MAGPDKIMLIRHAEKPVNPPPDGVNEDGLNDTHSLIVRGWQRAGALITYFARPTVAGIVTPNIAFAAGTSDGSGDVDPEEAKSLRPQQTIVPLCRKLGMDLNSDIPVGSENDLIAAVRNATGNVLIAWEHKHIPIIAGGFIENPPQWGDRFDAVWILDRQQDGSYRLSVTNQNLLDGDVT
jgi:hypothetical protein